MEVGTPSSIARKVYTSSRVASTHSLQKRWKIDTSGDASPDQTGVGPDSGKLGQWRKYLRETQPLVWRCGEVVKGESSFFCHVSLLFFFSVPTRYCHWPIKLESWEEFSSPQSFSFPQCGKHIFTQKEASELWWFTTIHGVREAGGPRCPWWCPANTDAISLDLDNGFLHPEENPQSLRFIRCRHNFTCLLTFLHWNKLPGARRYTDPNLLFIFSCLAKWDQQLLRTKCKSSCVPLSFFFEQFPVRHGKQINNEIVLRFPFAQSDLESKADPKKGEPIRWLRSNPMKFNGPIFRKFVLMGNMKPQDLQMDKRHASLWEGFHDN